MKSFVPTRAIPRGPRFVPNEVRQNDDGTTSIFLERKVGPRFTCTIDTSDYDTVQAYRWCANAPSALNSENPRGGRERM